MYTRKLFSLLTICFMLAAQYLFSQIVLEGVVTDNGAEYLGNGAEPVIGAVVTVTDQADASRFFSTQTDALGHYEIQITDTGVEEERNGPSDFTLLQNYPNPFNPSTVIAFRLARQEQVRLSVCNVRGRNVRILLDGTCPSGLNRVTWNGTDDRGLGVPAGVYIYTLEAEGVTAHRKMLLLDGHTGYAGTVVVSAPSGLLQKTASDVYTIAITGPDNAPYEATDVTIAADTQFDFTVQRTVTDIDGNVCAAVKIGDQWWTQENLKSAHYRNGEDIPNVTDDSEWNGLSTGAWCGFNNEENNSDTYGYLYNWYAVNDSRNIAPLGWHVPTDDEWKELEITLGMNPSEADQNVWRGTDEGSKLAGRADLWEDGELVTSGAFGESGFTALPGGYRLKYEGWFVDLGGSAGFWSATEEFDSPYAWCRELSSDYSKVSRNWPYKRRGYSVRLVGD